MKGEKLIAGIFISLAIVMLGGTVGMLGSYFLSVNAQAEEVETLQTAPEVKKQESQTESQISNKSTIPMGKSLTIDMLNTSEIEDALMSWKKIVEQVSLGILSSQDAGRIVYDLSSTMYKRNLPQAYSPIRLKYAIAHSKETDNSLKDIVFGEIKYDSETVVYIDVTEIYTKDQADYQLKLVYEDSQWHFDVTLPQ